MQKKRGGGKAKEAGAGKRVSRTYTKKSTAAVGSEIENENDDDENHRIGADGDGDENANGGFSRGRGRGRDREGRREGTPALDDKVKDEMKRLASKFREVDEYALEFEDMTGNSSSQMRDAR